MAKSLWEILVPANSNQGQPFSLDHHKVWDQEAKRISQGLTILKTSKGEWTNQEGKTFQDRMIPVRVYCTEKQINELILYTLRHYQQEAVMAYEISKKVKVVYKK
jgi:hypothetical protein